VTTSARGILNGLCFLFFFNGWIIQSALAIPVDDLEPGREWRVEAIEISGNTTFSDSELTSEMLTKARPWYLFWQDAPVLDPVTFREDLERLRRFYEARGYYQTQITHDLIVDPERSLVHVKIEISEGPPVIVADVEVEIVGSTVFPPELPIKKGQVFTEESYRKGEEVLRQFFLDRSYAHVATERRAEVNLDRDQVRVWYRADTGPPSVFGETTVEGTDRVDPKIVQRELTYQPGEPFSPAKIAESQEKILALNLFSLVRIAPKQVPEKPPVVPMEAQVREKEPREIRFGIGYGTEDEFRAQLEWRHNNWLGDARRLSILGKYSSISITGAIEFIQPHFISPQGRGLVTLRQDREDEETFLLNATRFFPRFEYSFSRQLGGFIGYRVEYSRLDEIDAATVQALGQIQDRGLLLGPRLGLLWNTTDEVFNPTKGQIVSLTLDQAGKIWGGRFDFYKITAEAKKYFPLVWQTVLASRLKIGLADPLGAEKKLPLFERFFSGGEKSVRGYARRKLGPLSAAGDPIGGLSLLEGSLELRRPLWGALGGAVFLDFGQVATRSFDVPVDNLQFSAGFGVSYLTPVGPLRFDVGFPFRPPRGEKSWQIHFSVGAFF
jgi:outer membrane protein assembly complex protein YaeT